MSPRSIDFSSSVGAVCFSEASEGKATRSPAVQGSHAQAAQHEGRCPYAHAARATDRPPPQSYHALTTKVGRQRVLCGCAPRYLEVFALLLGAGVAEIDLLRLRAMHTARGLRADTPCVSDNMHRCAEPRVLAAHMPPPRPSACSASAGREISLDAVFRAAPIDGRVGDKVPGKVTLSHHVRDMLMGLAQGREHLRSRQALRRGGRADGRGAVSFRIVRVRKPRCRKTARCGSSPSAPVQAGLPRVQECPRWRAGWRSRPPRTSRRASSACARILRASSLGTRSPEFSRALSDCTTPAMRGGGR